MQEQIATVREFLTEPKRDLLSGPTMPSVAILVPCYNEAATIGDVIADFRRALPEATIYVCDNNSSDATAAIAAAAGAEVLREPLQGKGNAVRRMFADIDAEVYVLVDGDATYEAAAAPRLVEHLVQNGFDMVNAARKSDIKGAYRPGHRFGNAVFTSLVSAIFGSRFDDILSGYRIFSRRFVKSFPALSRGFEIETELTVHALELRMPVDEVTTVYGERPEGSESKLSTFRDGWRILWTILQLMKEERPLPFFSAIFALLACSAILLTLPIFVTYVETGEVPRFPTAILASAMMILAFLSLTCGLILDTVTRGRKEMKRLRYLEFPAPGGLRQNGAFHQADCNAEQNDSEP